MSTAEFLASSRCSTSSLCAYHKARVGISEIPPPDVYAQPQVAEIAQIVSQRKDNTDYSQLYLVDKVRTILTLVNNYWGQNHQLLDGPLRENYVQWAKDAEKRGRFPAHGWMASPQQLSQLLESLKILREEHVPLDRWLILGTASGANTGQFVEPLQRAGIAPTLFILDRCEPPIKDSLAKDRVGLAADALHLPLGNESVQAVSTHFTTSFIPTEEQRISEDLDRADVMRFKNRLFQEIYRVLADDGVFAGAMGIPIGFPNSDEIMNTTTQAGFIGENTILVPTTDPTCYDISTGRHTPKNFFLITVK